MTKKTDESIWKRLFASTSAYLVQMIIPALLFVALAAVFGFWIHSYCDENEQHELELSQVIHRTVQELATRDLLLPEMVFIDINDSLKAEVQDSISAAIGRLLVSRFTKGDIDTTSDADFVPYFIFPENVKADGSYNLTEQQIKELKAHLRYLAETVEKQVNASKAETAKDIDRLNYWISIWIGVLGFFGVLIPIVINFDAVGKANEAEKKSIEADERSQKAESDSDLTKKRVDLTYSLGRLRYPESSNAYHLDRKKYIHTALNTIRNTVKPCGPVLHDPMMKDFISELAIALHGVSTLPRVVPTIAMTREINEFITWLEQNLITNFQDDFIDEFVRKLDSIIRQYESS